MTPEPATREDVIGRYVEQIGMSADGVLNAIHDCAAKEFVLLRLRKDRQASAEDVRDAATGFREAKRIMEEAINSHVSLEQQLMEFTQ